MRRTRDHRRAEEWALVLEAEGLTPRLSHTTSGWVLSVPAHHLERAATELWAYESENRAAPVDEDQPWAGRAPFHTGLGVAAGLIAFFLFAAWTQETVRWVEHGNASADWILRGQLWRTVTALTLHGDFPHVASNAVALVFFLTAVCRSLGPGLGAAMVLGVGALGNLFNAWFHGFAHQSVGASTAVFGALGLLGAIGVVERQRLGMQGRRAWVPLAAGVGILAMLGTGGPRVDLWAHFWGFGAGAGAGICAALFMERPESATAQLRIGVAAAGVVVLCWIVALA